MPSMAHSSGVGLDRPPWRESFAEPQYDGSADIPELAGPLGRQRSSSYDKAMASLAFKETVYISDLSNNTLRAQSVTRINPMLAVLLDDTARAVEPDSLPVAKDLVDDYVEDMKPHAPICAETIRRGISVRGTATVVVPST